MRCIDHRSALLHTNPSLSTVGSPRAGCLSCSLRGARDKSGQECRHVSDSVPALHSSPSTHTFLRAMLEICPRCCCQERWTEDIPAFTLTEKWTRDIITSAVNDVHLEFHRLLFILVSLNVTKTGGGGRAATPTVTLRQDSRLIVSSAVEANIGPSHYLKGDTVHVKVKWHQGGICIPVFSFKSYLMFIIYCRDIY